MLFLTKISKITTKKGIAGVHILNFKIFESYIKLVHSVVTTVINEVPNGPLKFYYDWREQRLADDTPNYKLRDI